MPDRLRVALLFTMLGTTGSSALAQAGDGPVHNRANVAVRVGINDNRVASGSQHGTRLTLHLVARMGTWHPDGDDAPGTPVPAFAEKGGRPTIPGPLVRVRAGTDVLVSVRNDLPGTTLTVHGLGSRVTTTSANVDSIQLEPGSSRTVHVRMDAPGTYYYWGTTSGRTLSERTREDAQLTGAIVVDPASGPVARDRIMVIGMWADTSGHNFLVRQRILVVLNGRSWPHTERLGYTVGDTVHWRVINASADAHPMHLHGFYYVVDSRGDGTSDVIYPTDARDKVVTDLMKPGTTMSMTWSPDRAGNWLFHCHLPAHFAPRGSLGMPRSMDAHDAHGTMNHAVQGMNGLVVGVTVWPAAHRTAAAVNDTRARRQIRLVIRPNANGTPTAPNFEFALDDGRAPVRDVKEDHGAPPLVLTRGEPVSIAVINTLREPTAVHWHGIELESYYDGVAGFSGTAQRLSPVIAPSDSFIALFTPPRAGTFIYHTHIDEERQQPAGLAGPIIVLEPGQGYDPARDLTVVASSPRTPPGPDGRIPRVAWLNGSATPAPMSLHAGVRYRIRFINMTMGIPGLRFELSQDAKVADWRAVAKDGAELPVGRQALHPARQSVSIGETADVEFSPAQAGEYQLVGRLGDGTIVATMLMHVSPN